MHAIDPAGLIAVLVVYAAASVIPALFPRLPIPGAVLEIVGGALLGQQALGLVGQGHLLEFLSELGLAVLFLMAGFEVDPAVLRGRPIGFAFAGWIVSMAIACIVMLALGRAGLIEAPILTALAVTTTAVGALMPVLRDTGRLAPPYGPAILAAGAVGEGAPVVALSLVAAQNTGRGLAAVLLLGFAVVAVLAIAFAGRLSEARFAAVVERTIGSSGQLPVRLMMLLTVALVLLTDTLGIDAVLGAFLAGSIARAAMPHRLHGAVMARLEGIGYGFLVPLFFINAGANLDLVALFGHPATLVFVPVFAAVMLLARGTPAFLFYRRMLSRPDRKALALHSATQLPVVVAIVAVGVKTGAMGSDQAAALVGGGIVTMLLFPALVGRRANDVDA